MEAFSLLFRSPSDSERSINQTKLKAKRNIIVLVVEIEMQWLVGP